MTEHKLPVKQLVILCTRSYTPNPDPANLTTAICRFAEPIALTSVFPYVPELMESFGVPKNDIARWAGITSSIFSICQAFTGLVWGAASDRYGRKPIILFGLFNTMWSMLLWGFSVNLPMALAARAFGGLSNGNVGILRTTVAELCPWKELQPRAFSVMPLVWTVGATFGPTLGGALANPLRVDPRKPRGTAFLERFPYVLPNLAAAAIFTTGILVGWLFLQETLESKKHAPDLGLRTGARLTAFVRRMLCLPNRSEKGSSEREPLLSHQKAHHHEATEEHIFENNFAKQEAPRVKDVLTYQTSLNLLVYTLLALYTQAYDQLLPVFMHHPTQLESDPGVSLPLKFAGGFGIDSRRIGLIFTMFAISSTMCQFLLFPPIARYLGVLHCLRIAFLIFPFVFFITPFISLISDPLTREIAMVLLLMLRGVGGTFSFPTSTIMLTNSAPSLRYLGTINGLATSFSAVGRAAGPTIGGGLFTWGVKRGYVIVPFWTLSAIAFIACIPTFWLMEGKGFGDDPNVDDEENVIMSEEEDCQDEDGRTYDDAAQSESEFGDLRDTPNMLSHASTRSSAAMAFDEEDNASKHTERRQSNNTLGPARSHSQVRRRSVIRRTSSIPVGMGKGFRRYSSNLGSTGIGAGGASWGGA
jgi:MFS family permease